MYETPSTTLPAHIEETIRAITKLQKKHDEEASPLQMVVERATIAIGQPGFVLALTVAVLAWVVGNLGFAGLGRPALDRPPFNGMQSVLTLLALYVAVMILTTQRRADKLADQRAQLTLELAILGEQKTAKVIELLEEIRRDNPLLRDRVDYEATAMAKPTDPGAVHEALTNADPTGTSDQVAAEGRSAERPAR